MLKQFLKFFRSNDESAALLEHPHIQQMEDPERPQASYLEFLLQQVSPRVEERLEAYPQSDPILEVATSIVLELFPELWEEPEGALRDNWSPHLQPPPPPMPGLESESTEVEDDDESGELLAEEEVELDGAQEVEEILEEEALEVVEVAEAPAGFVNALDETAEFEPPPPAPSSERGTVFPASLQDYSVLHGTRVLLAVLLDNDRLPLPQQLSIDEIIMAANLWMRLVAQDTELNDQVQTLARQVEQKFAAGHFSQARLLLQIFPANGETRINNDRQLFYEEMILRMGIRRRNALPLQAAREIGEALDEMGADNDAAILAGLQALESKAQVSLLVYIREQEAVEKWQALAQKSSLPGAEDYVLAKLPPRRWRSPGEGERPIYQELREHIVQPMLRDHVINHLKACYFILRAVGDTGLEAYLDSFFDWSTSCCDVNAVSFLPEIYNRTLGTTEFINDVFSDIYERHYKKPLVRVLEELDEATLKKSFDKAIDQIAQCDLGELAPGQFNVGGFVLDAYLGFEYSEPDFGFKIHRLV